jgi:hypothetical protein
MQKTDVTVGALVALIRSGELRLPEMQRRYVWPATRVRDLLDSLYRGYPSGAILVWETDKEMPSRDVALAQGTSPFLGHKLLLDGQQRLTSLAAVLSGEPAIVRGKKKPIEILFNLDHPEGAPAEILEVADEAQDGEDTDSDAEEEDGEEDEDRSSIQERLKLRTFVVANNTLLADPRWVKVTDIFKGEKSDPQLLKQLVKSFDDPNFDRYSKRLQKVRKIRDYAYVMHVLDKELTYGEVAEIFVRVNSLGMKLRGSDLALAQVTSRWQGALTLFEEFQAECEKKSFTIDLGLIIRAVVVFATGQSRFKTVSSTPIDQFKVAWEKAKAGLRFSMDFLRVNVGIEDQSLLSSPLFLITPAYLADKSGHKISTDEALLLRRWLFVANARGHYTRGSSETFLDSDLNVITKGGHAQDLLNVLQNQLGRFEIVPSDLAGRGKRSALFPTAYLALRSLGAKDWRTGIGLSLNPTGGNHLIQFHSVFPKTLVSEHGKADVNEIANLFFVAGEATRKLPAAPPEEYFAKLLQDQGAEAFEAHCLPLDPSLWTADAFPRFLEYRRAALAKAINTLLLGDESRRKGIEVSDLRDAGENERVEFKSSARWDYKENKANHKVLETPIVKSIAGFLNGDGGHLLVGVRDDGAALGLENDYGTFTSQPKNPDGYERYLRELISRRIGKDVCASFIKFTFEPLDEKDVCLIAVSKSSKPVYATDDDGSKEARFFVRVGNATQEFKAKEAVEYVAQRWDS